MNFYSWSRKSGSGKACRRKSRLGLAERSKEHCPPERVDSILVGHGPTWCGLEWPGENNARNTARSAERAASLGSTRYGEDWSGLACPGENKARNTARSEERAASLVWPVGDTRGVAVRSKAEPGSANTAAHR